MSILRVDALLLNDTGNASVSVANTWGVGISTNGVTRLVVTSNGEVGIGTTSPSQLLDINSDSIRVRTIKTPATAVANGTQGQISWDSNYIYVCIAANTWKRSALTTW